MKKITFLMMLLTVTFGFSQQEVVQDFEDGGVIGAFGAASASIVADPETGGTRGQVAMLTSNPEGELWQGVDISLLNNVELTTDKTMTLDVYSTTAISIAPKVIGGLSGAPNSTAAVSHTGSGWETLTVTFNEGLDNTVTANGVYSAFVIYYNWNTGTNNFGTQDSRVFYVDNISGIAVAVVPDAEPTTAAPTPPARNPAGVFSIYSDAYNDQPNVVFGAFDVGTQDITNVEIAGDNILKAVTTAEPGRNFIFADWGAPIDLSSMTHYHMDYWIDTEFTTGLILDHKFSNHVGDNGETSALQHVSPVSTFGEWVSIDIPITSFTIGSQLRNALRQYILTVAGADLDTRIIYLDNIYLYNNTLSTNQFDLESVSVSPNPTNNNWNVKTNNGQNITAVEVYDILGKQVMRVVPNASEYAINASELNAGIYLAKIISSTGSTTVKLVKN